VRLAPEGRPFVTGGAAVLGILAVIGWLGDGWWWAPAAVWTPIALWLPWFFRDPERSGPRGDRLVIAPADGRVVHVVKVEEPTFVRGWAHRVSVFMNVFDVHVNRHPVGGTVAHMDYRPGAFVNATLDKASEENERMSIGIETTRGPVLIRQIAGLIARRIVTDVQVGDVARQGERLGIIRFGSRVDAFVPADAGVRVREGDRTLAGVTVIAEWPE
jgi:phosphatidylserine decarboxylase